MSITDTGGEQRIFLRKASGLIRTAGGLDTFIYNLGLVSVGLGVGSIMLYGPAYYPGGDLLWSCLLAGFCMALIAFGFITWTVTLPRSGGVYVFGSRILPPALALTMSLVEITAWLFYCAIAAYWIVLIGISPALTFVGYLTRSDGLVAAEWVVSPKGRRAKVYTLTAAGRRGLADEMKAWQRHVDAVTAVVTQGER